MKMQLLEFDPFSLRALVPNILSKEKSVMAAAAVQEANIREVLSIAISKNQTIQQAISNYADPLSQQEKDLLLSITPAELSALRDIETKIKSAHQSTRGVWAGAIW
ncbi:hypothetical protein [Rhodopseudomonas sp. RCAM05734]|uniref:hypothetical protein n=1 Tax=Rhodopseudomonas sp. RCAM05734 TaxID=3457549 RepID=UPI004044E0A2